LAIQRTSNSKHSHRINTATIPGSFVKEHGGVVDVPLLLMFPTSEDLVGFVVLTTALAGDLQDGRQDSRWNRAH